MIYGVGSLLIAAAAGYWVLTQAAGQKGRVKTLGQWLGLIIIVVALAGAACKVYYLTGGKALVGGVCPICRQPVSAA